MDRLTDAERILAWKAAWHPSFAGIAIIDRNFTFRSVNPQFCKLLKVTPAELIGSRFQDVTHPEVRKKDEENAKMLINGLADFYLLRKKYLFSDGRTVEVVLMVSRAPQSQDGEFQFFVSRIMLDEDGELMRYKSQESESQLYSRMSMSAVVAFYQKHGKTLLIVGGLCFGVFLTGLKYFGVIN